MLFIVLHSQARIGFWGYAVVGHFQETSVTFQ